MMRRLGGLVGRGAKNVSRQGIYEFLDAQLSTLPRGSRVLSVGSGGEISAHILAAQAAHGIEVLQLDIQASRKPDIVADLCEWRSEQPFDAVICSEVLEHIWAPHLAIANMHASLRAGGKLIVTVPFLFPIHGAPHDYFRYTRHGLEVLLREFSSVAIEDRNSWAESFGVLAVRMARKRKNKLFGATVVPAIVIGQPLLRALGKLMPANEMPTGYNVVAVR